ncbi:hypothetical protein Tco_1531018 [Tanacetum coccineum]
MIDNRDNQRWDVFGASVISRMHRVLCDLGITFDRKRELDKQEVEQPEVDRFDLDEPGIGKPGVEFDLKSGLDNRVPWNEQPPQVNTNSPSTALTGVGRGIEFSCQGVKLSSISFTQPTSERDFRVVEFVELTLATTGLLRELRTLDLLSMILRQSRGILSKKLPPAAEFNESWSLEFKAL